MDGISTQTYMWRDSRTEENKKLFNKVNKVYVGLGLGRESDLGLGGDSQVKAEAARISRIERMRNFGKRLLGTGRNLMLKVEISEEKQFADYVLALVKRMDISDKIVAMYEKIRQNANNGDIDAYEKLRYESSSGIDYDKRCIYEEAKELISIKNNLGINANTYGPVLSETMKTAIERMENFVEVYRESMIGHGF